MADTKNTEVPTAAPVTVVRERSSWVTPLVASLVVVAALVLGGVSGFALSAATHSDHRPAIQVGLVPGQMQHGPQQAPGPRGERPDGPDRPGDEAGEATDG